jgi:hypothetical protein
VILPGPHVEDAPGRRHRRAGLGASRTPVTGPDGAVAGDGLHRRTIRMRVAAAVLGVLALAAGLVTAVAVSAAGPSPGVPLLPAAVTPAPTSGAGHSTRPIRPYPDLPNATGSTGGSGGAGGAGSSGGSGDATGTGGAPGSGAPGGTVTAVPPAPSTAAPGTSDLPPAESAGGVKAARARVTDFVAALNDNDPDRANGFLCSDLAGSFGAGMLNGIQPGSLGVGGVSVRGSTGTAYVSYLPVGGGEPARALFGLVVEHQQWMICDPPS